MLDLSSHSPDAALKTGRGDAAMESGGILKYDQDGKLGVAGALRRKIKSMTLNGDIFCKPLKFGPVMFRRRIWGDRR